jgi:hypothetical protein
LLVTRGAYPFLQLLVLADTPSAQLVSVRAQLFSTSIFDLSPSLCRALLFSTSSLCLCYFILYEALRFRARARWSSEKDTTAQTGAAEHCQARHIAGRELETATIFGCQKINYPQPLRVCRFQRKRLALRPFLRWREPGAGSRELQTSQIWGGAQK